MKVNEGEVPQYYVSESHPAIIEPEEWEHVQHELARRKALGHTYSGKSTLASKLVCESCGSFYGSKLWHSTDKYRRTIWQCNGRFKKTLNGSYDSSDVYGSNNGSDAYSSDVCSPDTCGKEPSRQGKSTSSRNIIATCDTPSLDTETIQNMFIQAYNIEMTDVGAMLKSCEEMRKILTDFTSIDAQIQKQTDEMAIIAEMVKASVIVNTTTAQAQDDYNRKYNEMNTRYEKHSAELNRLQAERKRLEQQDSALSLFARALKKQPKVLDAWDDSLWIVMVEKAIVHRDRSITFIFYNGKEITVEG